MNLNKQPTLDDLARLFAQRKDKYDSHILWVCESGEVRLDTLPPEVAEDEFVKRTPSMRARFRTYRRGGGYVGKKAAADRDFMGRLYQTLHQQWLASQSAPKVTFIDRYC
ncbi:hypothetical protein [Stutzerimonas tarimensis]|uniref:Uncharacterized protein n=1 Tax=Stutzerimonas tarimensis TaxID=1507735 RepID=A0ABV7T1Y3_9GAMM